MDLREISNILLYISYFCAGIMLIGTFNVVLILYEIKKSDSGIAEEKDQKKIMGWNIFGFVAFFLGVSFYFLSIITR